MNAVVKASDMVSIVVDGRRLEGRKGQMLIEVTDAAGIYIPRFCYHKHLSIAANCRMCLVEVEKMPKLVPACATPIMEGMQVSTRSELARGGQKSTMELLLINHPLDCPICDQGGECELQDLSLGYGSDVSRYVEGKRVVKDKNLGPLIATDMTRCIHCTRCVRFGAEVAGARELGATGRGENMMIGTYVERSVDSELSGNVIDLCPVGALTSKPFRFTARAWELVQQPAVAPHDSLGSNLYVHVRRNRVMRVVPRENEAINETWISDRDRFSYLGLDHEERLLAPRIRRDGSWEEVDWDVALDYAVTGLRKLLNEHGPSQLGTLVSPSTTLEEMALAAKLVRALGSANIDHRLRQGDFRDAAEDPQIPWLGEKVSELENVDTALVIGSDLRRQQPLLAHRLRKASGRGARISFLNPVDFTCNFSSSRQLVACPNAMLGELAGVGRALCKIKHRKVPEALKGLMGGGGVSDAQMAIATELSEGDRASVLLGDLAFAHPDFIVLRALAREVVRLSGATLGYVAQGANSVGAWIAGAAPHRGPGAAALESAGSDARTIVADRLKGYLLLDVEPEYDLWDPGLADEALRSAQFTVAVTAYHSAALDRHADVLLPRALFAETSGTYVNVEGIWQSFAAAVTPPGEARPGWKVLRVLGNLFNLPNFGYEQWEQIRDELQAQTPGLSPDAAGGQNREFGEPRLARGGLTRMGELPAYACDALVRHSGALQQTADARAARAIRICRSLAARLGLEGVEEAVAVQGKRRARFPLVLDERVPECAVWLAAGIPGSEGLGASIGPIELAKA
jgi:NADH-quinone oxidoreductase subunit G